MITRIHATCVDLAGVGVILRGDPGAGKSDLALRLIHQGARLVADDQVFLQGRDNVLYAFAPHILKGRLEVRGVGIIEVPCKAVAAVGCLVDLVMNRDLKRMPEPIELELAGVGIPCHRLDPFEMSAAQKVAAIAGLCNTPFR